MPKKHGPGDGSPQDTSVSMNLSALGEILKGVADLPKKVTSSLFTVISNERWVRGVVSMIGVIAWLVYYIKYKDDLPGHGVSDLNYMSMDASGGMSLVSKGKFNTPGALGAMVFGYFVMCCLTHSNGDKPSQESDDGRRGARASGSDSGAGHEVVARSHLKSRWFRFAFLLSISSMVLTVNSGFGALFSDLVMDGVFAVLFSALMMAYQSHYYTGNPLQSYTYMAALMGGLAYCIKLITNLSRQEHLAKWLIAQSVVVAVAVFGTCILAGYHHLPDHLEDGKKKTMHAHHVLMGFVSAAFIESALLLTATFGYFEGVRM